MKKLILLFLFCVGFTISQAQNLAIDSIIRTAIPSFPEKADIQIGIVHGDSTWKYNYVFEMQSKQYYFTEGLFDRFYEIGSITKTFTAALLAKAVRDGKIKLEDPIQHYLPVHMKRDSFQGQTIKVQHLVNHSSGLSTGPGSFFWPYLSAKIFNPGNPYKNIKAKHYYRYLKKFKLEVVPGAQWEYNNAAYGLLGSLIASAYDTTWRGLIEKELLLPLGFENSFFFSWDDLTEGKKGRRLIGIEKLYIPGFDKKGKPTPFWDMDFINPAGVMKASLNDMLKWLRANLEVSDAKLAFIQDTHIDTRLELPSGSKFTMGLGWVHRKEEGKPDYLLHTGATGGYSSYMVFSKELQQGVIILTNFNSAHPKMKTAEGKSKGMALAMTILEQLSRKP